MNETSHPRRPGMDRVRDKPIRSVLKSISWRVVGSIDTILLATLLTGGMLGTATKIGVAEILTKTVLYFLHERGWARAGFGQEAHVSPRYRKGHMLHRKPTEGIKRSAVKTASWRILASLDTMLLSWFFTGSLAVAAAIGGLEIFTKLILYYFHERIWARLRIGLAAAPAAPRMPAVVRMR